MADTTLWPWECHSVSAFGLFTLWGKDGRVFRWPMAVSAQNSKAPVLAPPCPGPDSGGGALGGPTWLWASEQAWLEPAATSAPGRQRERISPGPAYPTLRLRPAAAHLSRTVMPVSRRHPEAEGGPLPSEARPGHLPAFFSHPRPAQRAGQARTSTSGAQAGRRSRAVSAAQLPGPAPRKASGASAPELRTGIPGSRKQRKEGGRTRLCRRQRRSRGSGGTCWLGGRSAQPELDPGLFRKRAGGSPLRHEEARGGGVRGDDDLIVTWDLQTVVFAYLFVVYVWTLIHLLPPRCDGPSHNQLESTY